MLNLLAVEDNERLRPALAAGLEHTGSVAIVGSCGTGQEALAQCLAAPPDVVLMDVHLAGARERPAGAKMAELGEAKRSRPER